MFLLNLANPLYQQLYHYHAIANFYKPVMDL